MSNISNPESCSGTLFFDVNETLLDTKELNKFVAQRLGDRPERAEAWFTSLLHHSQYAGMCRYRRAAGTFFLSLPEICQPFSFNFGTLKALMTD